MSVEREDFGVMPDGTPVYEYIITNQNECSASVLSLGATLNSFYAEDKNGDLRDVLLGFDTVEELLEKSDYQGATVGPVCNRIGGAKMPVGDKVYELVANENGVTCLHAGGEFSFAVWQAMITDSDTVEFSYVSPDGKGGFPGETKVKVIFTLTDDNKLSIKYSAIADRDTYLNLTNHAYFNLNGYDAGTILNHTLQMDADAFTPVDTLSIPTGGSTPVAGTPMDFRTPHTIGERIDADFEQLKLTGGYDHNYCLNHYDGQLNKIATAVGDDSGIVMNVYTTLPGVQFYAGNFLSGKTGKEQEPMEKRTGFCLETQYFPDTPNHPEFPSCFFKAGEEYTSQTVYEFNISDF